MRRSIASLALIARRAAGETEYLAQWNADWCAFHLIGGHKLDDESFRECLVREIGEELGLSPDALSLGVDATAHLDFVGTSRRARVKTAYTFELFDVELRGAPALREIELRPENAWLRIGEIAAGVHRDGRPVSPTMPLLLGKTARLDVRRPSDVFTIGVTGHRDLRTDDEEATSRKLNAVFDTAERDAGTRVIEVVSPLAAGADQLFAQRALARGYRLISPLPLPLEFYRHDFSGESAVEFQRLLHRAAEWYSLPLHTERDVSVSGPTRDRMYEAVGRHVVHLSDWLVALWDGNMNGKRGGTSEIVQYARHAVTSGKALQVEIVPVRRRSRM